MRSRSYAQKNAELRLLLHKLNAYYKYAKKSLHFYQKIKTHTCISNIIKFV